MHPTSLIPMQLAVLFIVASGLCIIVRWRWMGLRLFFAGVVLAAAAALIPTLIQSNSFAARIEEIVAWLGVAGLVAAIFGARRIAAYLITPAVALWLVSALVLPALQPMLNWFAQNYWILLVILAAPVIAAIIAAAWVKRIHAYAHAPRTTHSFRRFVDWLFGSQRNRRRRDRHIGDAAHPRRRTNRDGHN